MNIEHYFMAILPMVAASFLIWNISLFKSDVSIVDSLWSWFFVIVSIYFFIQLDSPSARAVIVLALVIIWAVRLSAYITLRHWGDDEDHRYKSIREDNNPGFEYKSLYMIFAFQALVAWLISMPLFFAIQSDSPLSLFDYIGIALWLVGMYFEAVADYQLWKFKQNADNRGKIFTAGLWKYTRHPNYFGEFLIWWGFFCLALSTGAYWTVISPLLMTYFLMKFSGVGRLEQTMKLRPGYESYMKTTNAFFPDFKQRQK